MSTSSKRRSKPEAQKYSRFELINGEHDFKQAVPDGYVEYSARKLRHGRVAYFNFALAEEMGLTEVGHEHHMNPELESAILDTFALQIINEYDILHNVRILKRDVLPGKYMATRYLQLQHPSKRGTTSGDGRSIWNGQLTHRGVTWDTTSCGTGATRLSPAAATLGHIPMTGDPNVSYGCGKAAIDEGLTASIQSEIFHRNGIGTERILAVIEFPDGYAINVRAGTCLLRPSHFFHHLKQGNRESLKHAIDYFIKRQIGNKHWPELAHSRDVYFSLASRIALEFARMAARFEAEYIFVWMDWDGDNILANAGIIDYGSVRQFGLYHREYRFDDGDRWSTTLPEQRLKARQAVQNFIQIADFLTSGKKKNFKHFKNHSILATFDREFDLALHRIFLKKIGFQEEHQDYLLNSRRPLVRKLRKIFSSFEGATRARRYRVPDGITRDAVYCMRDLLRELPGRLLARKADATILMSPKEFMACISSDYSKRRDRTATPWRAMKCGKFLKIYESAVQSVQSKFEISREKLLEEMSERAIYLNPKHRITGTSIIVLTEKILKSRKRGLSAADLQALIEQLIGCNVYEPDASALREEKLQASTHERAHRLLNTSLRIVEKHSESL